MLKNICLFCLTFLFCNQLLAQDWSLFPYGRQSFYIDDELPWADYMYAVSADSMLSEDAGTKYLFNTHYFDAFGACKDSAWAIYDVSDSRHSEQLCNYMIVTPDSVICITYYPEFDSGRFVFYPTLPPGASWTNYFDEPYLAEVITTCDSAGFIDVLGSMDSVKYYSVSVNDTFEGETNIDKTTYILSKSHGFIAYPSLWELSRPKDCNLCYTGMHLSGYILDEDTVGYTIPKWSDYFQLQPGDLLKFHLFGFYTAPDTYRIHIIDSVEKHTDSVEIFFHDEYQNAFRDVFYKKALQYVLQNSGNMFYPGPGSSHSNDYDFGYIQTMRATTILLNTEAFPGKIIQEKRFSGAGSVGDTCQISMNPSGLFYTFDSYRGVIAEEACGGEYGCNGYTLVGSILSGHVWGDVSWENPDQQNSLPEHYVYPNPAQDLIYLNDVPQDAFTVHIFAADGKEIRSGVQSENAIYVSDISPGIYLLEISNDAESFIVKFVKK
ncbi:MAG: T9SS type A sorting domain-containing protein [Chitinophagales bacterium]